MEAVVAAFNQEKALVGAFSVITNLRMELFQALLDTETGLCTFYISTPATAEYYTLVMVAGCNWGWSIIASCNWTQQETRSDWFSTELGDVFFDTILLWPVWSIKLIQSFIL